jgi:predicted nucleic acid-binding protein
VEASALVTSPLIETDGPLAVTESVVMEVLAGARDRQREERLRRLMTRFPLLAFDPVADLEGAAASTDYAEPPASPQEVCSTA